MDDEFEIEITDLRTERSSPGGDLYTLPRPVRLNGLHGLTGGTAPMDDIVATPLVADAHHTAPLAAEATMHAAFSAGVPHSSDPTLDVPSRLPADESFDIEITDLSGQPVDSIGWLEGVTGPKGALGRLSASVRQTVWPWARNAATRQTTVPREVRRRRLAGGVAALGAVVAALLVVLSGSPVPRTLQAKLFATPTATSIGANTLLLANTAPWGQLRIDGKQVTPSAFGGVQLVNLSGGRHEIRYDAPPFPALRCHLSVPAAAADNCPQAAQSQGQPLVTFGAARLLDLGVSVRNLAPGPLDELTLAVQGLLDALTTSTSVAPGDHFATDTGQVVAARQPLRATLRPVLNTDPSAAPNINGTVCITLCDNQGGYGNGYSDSEWTVLANVRSEWDITTSDGTPVGVARTAIPGAPIGASLMSLPVALTWTNGAWQLGAQDVTGLANPAGFDVGNLALCTVSQQIVPVFSNNFGGNGASSSCLVASNPADGCVVTWQADDSSGNPLGAPAYLLYRFGVLLAANPVAVKGFPDLTVATSQEQTLARRIVATTQWQGPGGPTPAVTPGASGDATGVVVTN